MTPKIAVFYLARAADKEAGSKLARFAASYRKFDAGEVHDLFVILKGYKSASDASVARRAFSGVDHKIMTTSDEGFDLGSYFAAVAQVDHDLVCFFNTSSIIQSQRWLSKLASNLLLPNVGMVGATGSFQNPGVVNGIELTYPNIHIRSNAFLMRREDFNSALPLQPIRTKTDAYEIEHGATSLTQMVLKKGMIPLVVGRNGRGYAPEFWPVSDTFRQGEQSNLLVGDNQTEVFRLSPLGSKIHLFAVSWSDGQPPKSLLHLGFQRLSQPGSVV